MKFDIQLSQCMIVKNEEKNIRRALSWGKKIMYEQIVVDTGSTDRTIEIAKEMGAKVLNFPWIDDFSSAKNFAIRQATGNWIAFLDADEYYSEKDSEKILPLLEYAEKKCSQDLKPDVVRSAIANITDNGEVGSTSVHDRIFRNNSLIYYKNRVHEVLHKIDGTELKILDASSRLTIYHTGYTSQAFKDGEKISRNIRLLKNELEHNPENYNAWSYMGDSLIAANLLEQAEIAYLKVINYIGKDITDSRKNTAYSNFLKIKYKLGTQDRTEVLDVYRKSREAGCTSPDIEYWLGEWFYMTGDYESGKLYLEEAITRLDGYDGVVYLEMAGNLEDIYMQLFDIYMQLSQDAEAMRYGVFALRLNRYNEKILSNILILLMEEPGEFESANATFDFLNKIYDYTLIKDKLFLIKNSKVVNFLSLENKLYDLLSEEEECLLRPKRLPAYTVSDEEALNEFSVIPLINERDREYMELIKELKLRDLSDLENIFRKKLIDLEEEYKGVIHNYKFVFSRFPYWGTLEPELNQFHGLNMRFSYLKENINELLWLYSNMNDYQSKKILIGILKNWIFLDTDNLSGFKNDNGDIFDEDLVSTSIDKVYVDVGSGEGNCINNFIKKYGKRYNKIYCYEPAKIVTNSLERNTKDLKRIIIKQAALSSSEGLCSLNIIEKDNDTWYLTEYNEEKSDSVDMLMLDNDVKEKIDILKIDVNGWEKETLIGAKRHIVEERPLLIISLYNRIEDLTELPRLVLELQSNYKLFLRYYGGDLIPTNIILYAI